MSRLGLVFIAVVIVAGLATTELNKRWKTALEVPAGGYHLTVFAGETLGSVVTKLHNQGVVPYPSLVRLYGRWSGLDREIKPGEYLLPQYLGIETLLALLTSGNVIQYQVTMPEGIKLQQALLLMVRDSRLNIVLDGPGDPKILELVAPHSHPEGLFFPDSYHYELGATDWQILQRSHSRMQTILGEEWSAKADNLPYKNKYEALIMASIIERETGKASERGKIAGVFVRRLQKRMRLQTDPTVIYGLGDKYDGNLRRVDLQDDSNPYNTYRHQGLPPSPIALPGREAIHAALNPDDGNSLYFVARGDGGHEFSSTLKEHQKAVRKYQLKRRADYRSSPEKE